MFNKNFEILLPLNENYRPGDNYLLVDSCQGGSFYMDLVEATTTGRLTKFRGKFQEAEAVNKNKRMYPYQILDENLERLKETISDGGLVGELDHACFQHKNFDVLTVNGWKKFVEIREGDMVFSRVNGEMIPSKVKAIVDQPYDGKTIRVKGRAIDCTFTAPHKFMLCHRNDHSRGGEEYYETIETVHHNRTKFGHDYIPKVATWEGLNINSIILNGVNRQRLVHVAENIEIDAMNFAGFIGLYLAEGSISHQKNSNLVLIDQKTEYGRILIRKLLADFHPDIVWKENKRGFYVSDARLYDYLIPLGGKYTKYIPKEIKQWAPKYLERLLVAFAIGDGRILKSEDGGKTCNNHKIGLKEFTLDNGKFSRMSVFSVSEELVDDLHECAVKCGVCGTREIVIVTEDHYIEGRLVKAENQVPLHCLNLLRTKAIHMDPRFLKTIEGHHQGRVYCLTTEHGNFYMKYKGHSFWTGNSDSIIHFTNASHKITKLWWDGNTLMGEGEILSTPHGQVLKSLINDGVRIGISSRGVGNGKVNEEGILVIGESYKLITFDAVADPSTFQAFQKEIEGNKRENYIPKNSFVKNSSRSIHNISKEQVLACLGGIVTTQTNELKRGLNNG